MRAERITTKKLAQICGVSLGTVDRALNNRSGISPSTRERILAAADVHGYRPNRLGRSLQSGKTYDLGVVIHDLDNRFFSQLVNAIQKTAWEYGYFVELAVTLRDPEREIAILNHLIDRNVDGLLIFPSGREQSLGDYLSSLNKPVVCIGNKIDKASNGLFIGLDDEELVYHATHKLGKAGYRKLVFVAPFLRSSTNQNNYEAEQRLEGFRRAASSLASDWEILDDWDYQDRIKSIMDSSPHNVGIVCTSDIFALEIMEFARTCGIKIPNPLGILGFDDIDLLRYIHPHLSTIRYPIAQMGQLAVEYLIKALNGDYPDDRSCIVSTDIMWRESTV